MIIVDYLTFTSHRDSVSDILKWLNFVDFDFVEAYGRYGYERHLLYDNIHIYSGGNCGTVCVELSGQGVRWLEEKNKNWDWFAFFQKILVEYEGFYNVSRLDLAYDERDGFLDIQRIARYANSGRYVSIWKGFQCDMGSFREMVTFGSRASDCSFQIYNKALERGREGHWLRLEFRLKGDMARRVIMSFLGCGDISYVYFGLLNKYLRFCAGSVDRTNTTRQRLAAWWADFLEHSERLKLPKLQGIEYNAKEFKNMWDKMYSGSARAYIAMFGKEAFITACTMGKMSQKHATMVQKESCGEFKLDTGFCPFWDT